MLVGKKKKKTCFTNAGEQNSKHTELVFLLNSILCSEIIYTNTLFYKTIIYMLKCS